ncbi:SNF2-related protein [Metarhizium album ARSEF 1941]|uniref:SNF2-related protein n=1 Tax=Metarhizium album (strain ARSEF 1941) TaxID=1081103 RepID=A0A0B2WXY7_METAS|nr:SNF2-related protein [Metarhizium album ARSEF 1941]KHN98459.1 SNF2-related protein [Metarhizium album ARSEF 1941]
MAEDGKRVKVEADAVAAAVLVEFALQPSGSKIDFNDAQMDSEVTTCLENNPQNTKEEQGMDRVQVKKEPDIARESNGGNIVQELFAEDSQYSSGLGQPPRHALTAHVRPQSAENDDDSQESSDTEKEDEDDSDFECPEDEDKDTKKSTKAATEKPSQGRPPPAKNAREFIARLHKKQDGAAQQKQKSGHKQGKRKGGTASGNPFKRPKTTNVSSESDLFVHLPQGIAGGFVDAEPLAPAMPDIDASTHRKQFAKLRDMIPKDADTRRTRTQRRDLKEAARLFGYKKVKAIDGKWLLKGMETALHGHQITAAAWMVKRECARAGPFGGLIADEMGMGKTITSLACVVGNPPEAEDLTTYISGTLVIVPSKIIADQWMKEVKKHCSDSVRGLVSFYYFKASSLSAAICGSLKMVITTTKEVKDYFQRHKKDKLDQEEILGLNWYRIILDEAHSIKNLKSLTKQSMCTLRAKHRWALTGTPLSNAADGKANPVCSVGEFESLSMSSEMIPYLQFIGLKIEEAGKKAFRREYMDQNKANAKLEALISTFMYRRTKRDTFLSHQILPIPGCETHNIWVPLADEEQAIYIFVRELCSSFPEGQGETEMPPSAGSSKTEQEEEKRKRKSVDMRRLISHPYNIERLLHQLEEECQIQDLRSRIQAVGGRQTILQQILSESDAKLSLMRYQSGLDQMGKFNKATFGGLFEFDEHLAAIQTELRIRDSWCIKCLASNPTMPRRIPEVQ